MRNRTAVDLGGCRDSDCSPGTRFPFEDIFVEDMLHMNAKGYAIWKDAVRPIMMEKGARMSVKLCCYRVPVGHSAHFSGASVRLVRN